jgi:hypothetical protein
VVLCKGSILSGEIGICFGGKDRVVGFLGDLIGFASRWKIFHQK